MTGRPLPPQLRPTARMWQILHRCYQSENPVAVLGRALDMLADADGHLHPDGTLKTGPGRRAARRTP